MNKTLTLTNQPLEHYNSTQRVKPTLYGTVLTHSWYDLGYQSLEAWYPVQSYLGAYLDFDRSDFHTDRFNPLEILSVGRSPVPVGPIQRFSGVIYRLGFDTPSKLSDKRDAESAPKIP